MDQNLTDREIKKMSRYKAEVFTCDDGRFAFMGRIYDSEEELVEAINRNAEIAKKINNSWFLKLFRSRKEN